MIRNVIICSVLFFASVSMSSKAQENTSRDKPRTTPPIRVEVFSEYLVGFPYIVSIVCYNPSDKSEFYNLPEANLLSAPGPVAFTLIDADGNRLEFPAASTKTGEGPSIGFTLSSGGTRRMLFDLSNLNVQPDPGEYTLEATYTWEHGTSDAPPETVTFIDPSSGDSTIAAILRSRTDSEKALWSHFLRYNWRTIYTRRPAPKKEIAEGRAVDASGLSEEGRESLALHLFLHRATYGPKSVAELSPAETEAFAEGPLKGEAAVLRYEILTARGDASASTERKKILDRFPGLKWRIEAIDEGNGRLRRLRRRYGPEQDGASERDFLPYTEK